MKHLKLFEDFYKNKYIYDLLNVGKTKAVGYLPIGTIEKYGSKEDISDLIEYAKNNNLKYKILDGTTYSGALYFYDYNMLKDILEKNKDIIVKEKSNLPLDPDEYVIFIEYNTIFLEEYPLTFKLIAETFNDIGNINRVIEFLKNKK